MVSAILLIVLLNAVMGVVQEAKAGAALEALKKMTTTKSFVYRDGVRIEVSRFVPRFGLISIFSLSLLKLHHVGRL